MIEVIGESFQGNDGHDLGDLTIAITGVPNACEVFVTHPAAIFDKLLCEAQRNVNLGVGRRRLARVSQFTLAQAD